MKTKRALFSMFVILSVFWFSVIFSINKHFPSAADANQAVMGSGKTTDSNSSGEALKSGIPPFYNESNRNIINERSLNPEQKPATSIQSASIAENETTGITNDETSAVNHTNDPLNNSNGSEKGLTANTVQSENSVSPAKSSPAVTTAVPASESSDPKEKESQKKESSKYSDIGISVAESYVNIREEADTKSSALGKLYRDSAAKILRTDGDWYYVESGSIKGYVKSQYIKTGISDDELIKKYGTVRIAVTTDGLNVREKPDTASDKLTTIYLDEKYPVIELQNEWVKVDINDDHVIGYVKKEYVNLIVVFKKAISKEEEAELLRIREEERMKKETAVKYRNRVDYTDSELKLLACLVHAEAGNQSFEGRLAVANIVLNRVRSSKYPDTIKDVIYQSGQFSVARSGSLDKQLSNYGNYSTSSQLLSVKAARAALEGANNVGKRLYFHSYKSAVRKGYDHKDTCVKIEDQLFW